MFTRQRLAVAVAIAMTALLIWAAAEPAAGKAFAGGSHWAAHFAAFAVLASAWVCGMPKFPAWLVGIAVVLFGFAHEAYEIVGHGHGFELADAVVNAAGALAGAFAGAMVVRFAGNRREGG